MRNLMEQPGAIGMWSIHVKFLCHWCHCECIFSQVLSDVHVSRNNSIRLVKKSEFSFSFGAAINLIVDNSYR